LIGGIACRKCRKKKKFPGHFFHGILPTCESVCCLWIHWHVTAVLEYYLKHHQNKTNKKKKNEFHTFACRFSFLWIFRIPHIRFGDRRPTGIALFEWRLELLVCYFF